MCHIIEGALIMFLNSDNFKIHTITAVILLTKHKKIVCCWIFIYPGGMTTLFKGCFGFIFGVIVNMTGFCYKETHWHFEMNTKFDFKTLLMFFHVSICCC